MTNLPLRSYCSMSKDFRSSSLLPTQRCACDEFRHLFDSRGGYDSNRIHRSSIILGNRYYNASRVDLPENVEPGSEEGQGGEQVGTTLAVAVVTSARSEVRVQNTVEHMLSAEVRATRFRCR